MRVAEKTVERLCLYRRLLIELRREGVRNVFSHVLGERLGLTAAQVRRDVMAVGYSGSTRRGYDVVGLGQAIGDYLDRPEGTRVVVVGLGNLGRALVAYFTGRREKLSVVAGFDSDPAKTERVLSGCRIYPMDELRRVADKEAAQVAMLAVPAAQAQAVAEFCVGAGIQGLLNFAPVRLRVPDHVYVLDVDLAVFLEKVAFFSGKARGKDEVADES